MKLPSHNLKTLFDRLSRHDESGRDFAIREPIRYELEELALDCRRRAAWTRAEHLGGSFVFDQRHQAT